MSKHTTYYCDGFRPVVCDGETDIDPAEIFAGRAARREYGRGGRVAALRLDSWTPDGRFATYEAFIGRRASDGNGTVGHNIWIVIETVSL